MQTRVVQHVRIDPTKSARTARGCHPSGIEVRKLMRELKHVNKSLNTATGVSRSGLDQPARENSGSAHQKNKADMSSSYRLTKGAVRDRHLCGCSHSQPDTER